MDKMGQNTKTYLMGRNKKLEQFRDSFIGKKGTPERIAYDKALLKEKLKKNKKLKSRGFIIEIEIKRNRK